MFSQEISESSFNLKIFASITSSGTSSFFPQWLSSIMLTRAPSLSSSATYLGFLKWQQRRHCSDQLFHSSLVQIPLPVSPLFVSLLHIQLSWPIPSFSSFCQMTHGFITETRQEYNSALSYLFTDWVKDWQWPAANNFKRNKVHLLFTEWLVAWRALGKVCTSYNYLVNVSW